MTRSRTRSPTPAFGYVDGVRLTAAALWFDAPRVRESVVVSHADLGMPGRGARAIATPGTLAVLAALAGRRPPPLEHALAVPYGQPFALGALRLELVPSGRLRGAAACLVEEDGRRLLYAGVVSPTPGPLAEPLEVRTAEAVAIDGCFADPRRAFPPRDSVEADLVDFARLAVAAGDTPVVLASALSVAPDLAAVLATAGLHLRAHPRVLLACLALRGAGAPVPGVARYAGRVRAGEVLLWPEDAPLDRARPRLRAPRVAWVSPWAAVPGVRPPASDRRFALATEPDYRRLREYLAAARAREVYLVRGRSAAVEALRADGLRVVALGPPRQMELF
jgi:putative mRNA 3-end processing factor